MYLFVLTEPSEIKMPNSLAITVARCICELVDLWSD